VGYLSDDPAPDFAKAIRSLKSFRALVDAVVPWERLAPDAMAQLLAAKSSKAQATQRSAFLAFDGRGGIMRACLPRRVDHSNPLPVAAGRDLLEGEEAKENLLR
jgi:hypothetical protein